MTALSFDNAVLDTRQGTRLIDAFSATLGNGITALVGGNGVGKSTLLNAIFALHPLAGGTIALDGIDHVRARRAFCRAAVFQPQNFSTYPEMTGTEFLAYCGQLRGLPRTTALSRAGEWLSRVGLGQQAAQVTGRYSQGMLQRLGIAYALQANASLCVLDEPFAGVDPSGRAALSDLLAAEARERIVLVCTHHVEDMVVRGATVLEIANRAARLIGT